MIKKQKWNITFIILILGILLSSCFKEDVRIPMPKGIYPSDSIVNSIYNFESYFSLDSGRVLKFNPVTAWDLAFESSAGGWHILVNAGGNKQIASTGKYSFSDVSSSIPVPVWKFDASSGNLDSTAVGKWVDTTHIPFQYTGEVLILGNYNSTSGNLSPYKKVKFILVTDSFYKFAWTDFNGSASDTSIIYKNKSVNYTYFSFNQPNATLSLEPDKDQWDLKFCPYKTIVDAPDGTPTPYPVRGVLMNRNKVLTAKDSLIDFDKIIYSDLKKFSFSAKQDAIGYTWKVYNFSSQTYFLLPTTHYIIKSVNSNYFKLRFTEFYRNIPTSQEGYPVFEVVKLTP